MLLAAGCRGGGSAAPQPSATPDLLAGAPADPAGFLVWAETQLGTFPSPIAVPTPRPVALRWQVVHFVDHLDMASVATDPAPASSPEPPLARLGPLRSGEARPGVVTDTVFHRKLGRFVAMRIGGFAVPTEDIGSIVLDVKVPFGRHLEVSWSPYGFARMPLPDNERFWTLRLATDGFEDWKGTLEALTLRTDGEGEGAIEVRALELHGHREAFPETVAATSVTLGGTRRPTIYARSPTGVRFPDVLVPPGGAFRATVGRQAAEGVADVYVEIVDGDGALTSVLHTAVTTPERWHDVSASLARWAGQRVTVQLRVASTADDDIVFWGDPTLYEPVESPPLLVVYLIDTLSAEHIGFYGHTNATMPTLGALARSGAWFEHMYCNSPVTIASIPDLMLSVSTERHGVHSPSLRPPDVFRALPEVLRAAGFATFSAVTNVNAGPRQAMDRGFGTFVDRIAFSKELEADRTVPLPEVRAWIAANADRPMFLYVHTAEPHSPYLPPAGYADRFDPDYAGTLSVHPTNGLPAVRTARDLQHARALYDAEVLYADARLGAFLKTLDALGVRQRSTILVTADHGEELLDHGQWGHGPGMYDEVLRVPLVLAGQGIPAVGRITQPAQMYDVKPTMLALAGVAPTHPLEGANLLPLMTGDDAPFNDRSVVVSHHRFWGHGALEYAVIEGERWKLLFRFAPIAVREGEPASRFQLFDIVADPDETVNLLDDQPEVVRRLVGALLAYRERQVPVAAASGAEIEYDPAQLRQLRALGYIE